MHRSFILLFLLAAQLLSAQPCDMEKLRKHIDYLASPQLEGRKSGTRGDSLAAAYIHSEFSGMAGDTGKVGYQQFNITSNIEAGKNNTVQITGKTFVYDTDFRPLSFSASGTFNGTVVFAGYGLKGESGGLKWNDYENNDVTGKWVVAFRGDPEPDNISSGFIPVSTDRAKALAAKDHGALGLMLVTPSSVSKTDQLVAFSFDKSGSDAGIPVISISRELAAHLLGTTADELIAREAGMMQNKTSVCQFTDTRVKAQTNIRRIVAPTYNIYYTVPGSDPAKANEFVVVGAHYDHLGLGGTNSGSRVPDTSAVHGGADDNASGVAAMLELARYFTANPAGRSMIFVAFGAEEMGMLGAKHFVEQPPVAKSKMVGMINLDMVGRLRDSKLTIQGTGTFENASARIGELGKDAPFELALSADGYGPSDHAAFYSENIPVLFLTTGAHEDYHTPGDNATQINYLGLSQVTDFARLLAESMAGGEAPVYSAEGGSGFRTNRSTSLKVTLGIMPDVSGGETSGGMKVEGVRKDGPADKAGLTKGDIITAINGAKVSNIYDYMARLGTLKPGEVASIELLRQGKTEVFIVQL